MKNKLNKNYGNNNNIPNAYNIINIGSISNLSLNTNKYELTDVNKNDSQKDDFDEYDRVNLRTLSREDFK